MDFQLENKILVIARGIAGKDPIKIDLATVYEAESRLPDTRFVNSHTAVELTAVFNDASGLLGKYISWVNYEILQAEKEFDLAKATVILDKLPEKAKELKDSGIKINEDYRSAMIAKDEECATRLDVLNGLKATKEFLESKHKLFERAYYSCRNLINQALPRFTPNSHDGALMEPQKNFMGKNQTKPTVDDDVIAAYQRK